MKSLAILTPTLGNGGAERIISTLSFYFKNYYNVTILTFDNNSTDYQFDCEIIDLSKKYSNKISSRINFIKYVKTVNLIKREMNFDIVLSFMEGMGVVNSITKKNEVAIHAVSSYLSGQYKYSKCILKNTHSFISKLLIKFYFNRLDGIFTISKESQKDLTKNFKIKEEKIYVSYNPYDLNMIQSLTQDKAIKNKNKTIVTMGSLIDVKSQWSLIRVFNQLKKENNNLKLLIIGRGKNESYLRELVNKYEINEFVEFLGYITNPFVYLKNSDIYVLCSIREGLPNAVIEAMACGLPIIATDCSSGPREILAPQTDCAQKTQDIEEAAYGILVPVNDGLKKDYDEELNNQEEHLLTAIKKLIDDDDLRKYYSNRSKLRCRDFEAKIIIDRWRKYIEMCCLNKD